MLTPVTIVIFFLKESYTMAIQRGQKYQILQITKIADNVRSNT